MKDSVADIFIYIDNQRQLPKEELLDFQQKVLKNIGPFFLHRQQWLRALLFSLIPAVGALYLLRYCSPASIIELLILIFSTCIFFLNSNTVMMLLKLIMILEAVTSRTQGVIFYSALKNAMNFMCFALIAIFTIMFLMSNGVNISNWVLL